MLQSQILFAVAKKWINTFKILTCEDNYVLFMENFYILHLHPMHWRLCSTELLETRILRSLEDILHMAVLSVFGTYMNICSCIKSIVSRSLYGLY